MSSTFPLQHFYRTLRSLEQSGLEGKNISVMKKGLKMTVLLWTFVGSLFFVPALKTMAEARGMTTPEPRLPRERKTAEGFSKPCSNLSQVCSRDPDCCDVWLCVNNRCKVYEPLTENLGLTTEGS
ncbi:uncharacterized protein [Dermacentor andersoni]|uniref:uncharacterized protein n=1 Tax=Dermacentor andersoni TaxID=34620 RepID=UPI0024162713|nr:uncharacterized protein LOC126517500 [Dermacentor andersoni]